MKSSDSVSPFSYQQMLGSQNVAPRNDSTMNFNDNSSMLGQFSPPTTPDSALQLRREANNARERIRVKRHRECFMDLKDVMSRHVNLGKDVSRLALLRSATELIKKLERDIISMSHQNNSSRQGSMSDPPSPVSTGAMGMTTPPGAPLRPAMSDFQAVGLQHPFAPTLNNVDATQLFNPTLPNIPQQVSAAHAMQYQHLPTLNDLQQNMVNHPFEYIM